MNKLVLKHPEPLEKDIQESILEYLHTKKIYCWKEHSGGMMIDGGQRYMPIGLKGKSDILGILPSGRFLAIEVKRPSGQCSMSQVEFIQKINNNAGLAFVARSIDDVIAQGI